LSVITASIVMAGLAAFAEASAAECSSGPGVALAETGPGHPRLYFDEESKTWITGTSPVMTSVVALTWNKIAWKHRR
jgi:hypothetical protein